MIKLQDMTPDVYYKQSRDFQFIGRLYDLVLNSVKTNTDLINKVFLNKNLNSEIIDLLVMTLGFKSKHNYNIQQLQSLSSAFSLILKNKGTKKAIQTAIGLILNAEGIVDDLENFDDYITVRNNSVDIFISKKISDFNLFNDLLDYILPAGMTCNIIKGVQSKYQVKTQLITADKLTYSKTYSWGQQENDSTTGIGNIFPTVETIKEINSANSTDPNARFKNFNGLYFNSTSVRKIKAKEQNNGN
jgi:hypothetical protein